MPSARGIDLGSFRYRRGSPSLSTPSKEGLSDTGEERPRRGAGKYARLAMNPAIIGSKQDHRLKYRRGSLARPAWFVKS